MNRRPVSPENAGRNGTRWRDTRERVFAIHGDVCWVCGHVGAWEVDHVVRRADGGDPYSLDNLRPAHGSNYPCPVCVSGTTRRPRCCNQERNARVRPVGRVPLTVDPHSI
ncbi:hypothetical protein Aph02nite_50270 [Actinoplanes philippinensis]|uniref:HNH nuclease domain-containing protein n=1 Tax=Actinoplanes philippinensis TaxID=35752 RepID=A0A1I2IS06_9ACTN|nr:HNH endonuclease signature motif containing protein [Actinoplanes philippinensis]GIE79077.1 hypothetical protein Aph02nite_50270 [Actinoplanes philippinensis]SFF44428.1 hypothetical protein SAMN05421541_110335 [Actinoplanes philippinensis]